MAVSSAEWRGVRYAFGRGLDPREKDGVRAHPLVFAAGMLLHVGILAALVRLGLLAAGTPLPAFVAVSLAASLIAGAIAGAGLIVRRHRSPVLRVVSTVDDYASAVLVVSLLASAEASLLAPGAIPIFIAIAIVLAAYAPFGKIRHCVLFFVTRTHYGLFVGRRGVLGAHRTQAAAASKGPGA